MDNEDWGEPEQDLLPDEEVPEEMEFSPEYQAEMERLSAEAEEMGDVEVIPDDYDPEEVVDDEDE